MVGINERGGGAKLTLLYGDTRLRWNDIPLSAFTAHDRRCQCRCEDILVLRIIGEFEVQEIMAYNEHLYQTK